MAYVFNPEVIPESTIKEALTGVPEDLPAGVYKVMIDKVDLRTWIDKTTGVQVEAFSITMHVVEGALTDSRTQVLISPEDPTDFKAKAGVQQLIRLSVSLWGATKHFDPLTEINDKITFINVVKKDGKEGKVYTNIYFTIEEEYEKNKGKNVTPTKSPAAYAMPKTAQAQTQQAAREEDVPF